MNARNRPGAQREHSAEDDSPAPAGPPLFVTVEEAAQMLHCAEVTVWRRVADGSIPSTKIGRLRRIPRSFLTALAGIDGT